MIEKEQHIYNAIVYLLWGKYHKNWWRGDDHRVYNSTEPVTVMVALKGKSKADALKTLDTIQYEFKKWW